MTDYLTDPVAVQLLVGSLFAAGLVLIGFGLGLAVARERRARGME